MGTNNEQIINEQFLLQSTASGSAAMLNLPKTGTNTPRTRHSSVSSTASSIKRKRSEKESEMDMDVETDLATVIMERLSKWGSDIDNFLREVRGKMNKTDAADLQNLRTDMYDMVIELIKENSRLKGALEESHRGHSMSDIMRQQRRDKIPPVQINKKRIVPRKSYAAVIRNGDGQAPCDSAALKTQVMSKLDPVKNRLKINAIRSIKNGVVVVAADQADLDKIISNPALNDGVMSVQETKKRKPKMIIYDVPSTYDGEQVLQAINQILLQNDAALGGENAAVLKRDLSFRFKDCILA